VELLVVVVILGILSAVVVFALRGSDKGRPQAEATDERIIRTALETYCARNDRYPIDPPPVPNSNPPVDEDAMETLVKEKYLATRSTYHTLYTGTPDPPYPFPADTASIDPEGNCSGDGPRQYKLVPLRSGTNPDCP